MTKTIKADSYDIITNNLINMMQNMLDSGKSWDSPFASGKRGTAINKDGLAYNGINSLILNLVVSCLGFEYNQFMTFKQASALGGSVRKGSKGFAICRYGVVVKNEGQTDETRIPFLKHFTVFNVAQIDNLPDSFYQKPLQSDKEDSSLSRLDHVDSVITPYIASLSGGLHTDTSAYYRPSTDSVHMPVIEAFNDIESYYGVLLHELSHSTGAKTRLNRDFSGRFGSSSYAFEELIAEISASFICNDLGINNYKLDSNHACYLNSWIQVLKSDKKAIFKAASEAKKACHLVQGIKVTEAA